MSQASPINPGSTTNSIDRSRGKGFADSVSGSASDDESGLRFSDYLDSIQQTRIEQKSTSSATSASSTGQAQDSTNRIANQELAAIPGFDQFGDSLSDAVLESRLEATALVQVDVNGSNVEIPGGTLPGMPPELLENGNNSGIPLQIDARDLPPTSSLSNQSSTSSQFDNLNSPVEPGPLTEQPVSNPGGDTFISSFDAALVQTTSDALNQSTVAGTTGGPLSLANSFQNGAGKTSTNTSNNPLSASGQTFQGLSEPTAAANTRETVNDGLDGLKPASALDSRLESSSGNEQLMTLLEDGIRGTGSDETGLNGLTSRLLSQMENGSLAATTNVNRQAGQSELDSLSQDAIHLTDADSETVSTEDLARSLGNANDSQSSGDHGRTLSFAGDFASQLTPFVNTDMAAGSSMASAMMESLPIDNPGGMEQIGMGALTGNNPGFSTSEAIQRINPMTINQSTFDRLSMDVADQVVQGLRSNETIQQLRTDDQTTVRLELDPPELGSLSVEIKRTQDVTRVHIVTDQSLAHSLLEKNVDSLIHSFRESSDHSFEVDVSHRDTNQQDHHESSEAPSPGVKEIAPEQETQQPAAHSDSSTATGINMIV